MTPAPRDVLMNNSSYVERILAHGLAHPDRLAVKDVHRTYTTLEFRCLVVRLARALDSVGVARGGRVAIVPTLRTEALAIRYAAGLLGCPTVFCPNGGGRGRTGCPPSRGRA